MSYKITVTHTQESLFDFLLYHTYSRASGFLINVLGFAVFLLGALQLAFDRISSFYRLPACIFCVFGVYSITVKTSRKEAVTKQSALCSA